MKYNREEFEAWCEEHNIETGRTVTVFEAWAKLQSERDEAMQALKELLEGCQIYPSALECRHDFDAEKWVNKHYSILSKAEE